MTEALTKVQTAILSGQLEAVQEELSTLWKLSGESADLVPLDQSRGNGRVAS